MKKNIRKLAIRSEIIRSLRALESRDLGQAIGGADSILTCPGEQFESGNINCPAPAAGAKAAGG